MDNRLKVSLQIIEKQLREQTELLNQLEEKLNILVTLKENLEAPKDIEDPSFSLPAGLLNMAKRLNSNTDRFKSIAHQMERSKAHKA